MNDTEDLTDSAQIGAWAAMLARGEKVRLHRSRVKSILLALLMALIGLVGLVLGLSGDLLPALFGWLLVLLGAVSVVVLLRRAVSTTPAVVVSAEGISCASAKAGPVPWSQITDITAMRSAASTFVILSVTEEERSRQAGDGPGIELDVERSDDDSDPVLWLPNGLAADEQELVVWLSRERAARGA